MRSCTIRRSFLLSPGQAERFLEKYKTDIRQDRLETWTEAYYDTQSHQLSNAECILMKVALFI